MSHIKKEITKKVVQDWELQQRLLKDVAEGTKTGMKKDLEEAGDKIKKFFTPKHKR